MPTASARSRDRTECGVDRHRGLVLRDVPIADTTEWYSRAVAAEAGGKRGAIRGVGSRARGSELGGGAMRPDEVRR
jgi:hypothetical protein